MATRPLNDSHESEARSMLGPSDGWQVVTPHDTNPLPFWPSAVEVGATGGTVVAIDKDGNTATFTFAAGAVKKMRPAIITTASTATPIIIHK